MPPLNMRDNTLIVTSPRFDMAGLPHLAVPFMSHRKSSAWVSPENSGLPTASSGFGKSTPTTATVYSAIFIAVTAPRTRSALTIACCHDHRPQDPLFRSKLSEASLTPTHCDVTTLPGDGVANLQKLVST